MGQSLGLPRVRVPASLELGAHALAFNGPPHRTRLQDVELGASPSPAASHLTCLHRRVLHCCRCGQRRRLDRIPFLLFPLVDASTALLVTLVMTRRALIRTGGLAVASAAVLFGIPALATVVQHQIDPYGLRGLVTEKGWLRPMKVVREDEETVYVLQFETAATGEAKDDVCYEALRVSEEMIRRHDFFDGTEPVIRLTRPDAPEKEIGRAGYSSRGKWFCSYE